MPCHAASRHSPDARQGTGGVVLVRDSKQPGLGNLALTSAQWRGLLAGIKSGQYSHLSR
ncbi:MAG TPA: DUF397 domain-containing protein [Streptosporangiaceae bacterium]|nr:DUF397 domain-containing protein [Streptosporangiaceae bacterium]